MKYLRDFLNSIKKYWLILTVLCLATISFLGLYPLPELPDIPGQDKTIHLLAYGVLALPVALSKPNKWLLFPLFFLLWSGAIEIIQPYVNRHGEWLDLIANASGIFLGSCIGRLLSLIIKPDRSV